MAPRYRVTLTKEERKELKNISTKGKRAARTVLYARALLLLDAGEYGPKWIVSKVAEAIGTTTRSLEKLKNFDNFNLLLDKSDGILTCPSKKEYSP